MDILKKNKLFFPVLIFIAALFASCGNVESGCRVEGTIKGAENDTLYIYRQTAKGYMFADMVFIDGGGKYGIDLPASESFTFYKMQLGRGEDIITFAIDTTGVISINGDKADFVASYTVEGSEENRKIKELNDMESNLSKQVEAFLNAKIDSETKRVSITSLINEYKINIREKYIAPATGGASAYYALFLKLRIGENSAGEYIFQPASVGFDNACLQEVAKSIAAKYPGSARAKEITKRAAEIDEKIANDKRRSEGFKKLTAEYVTSFDIKLPRINGDSVSLSSLADKVVLLDFVELGHVDMGLRNIELRELYEKYHTRGFEIYQIAYDEDENAWKAAAKNLPWISVHDNSAVNVRNYNVQALPTYFILGKGNELLYRDVDVEDINKTIEELLKK